MPGETTRLLSDLHYGDRATRIDRLVQLRPLLEGVTHLVLNGDTLDTRPGPRPEHTATCRAEVLAYFPQAAPRVTILTGNHDPDISPHHRLDLAASQVFVIHGDIVFDEIVPWSRDAELIGTRIATELAALSAPALEDLELRLAIWRRVAASIPQRHQSEGRGMKYTLAYLADTAWPPSRILKILQSWWVEPGRVAALARRHRPAARFVVTGHLHRPVIWRDPHGTVIINTGSFCRPLGGYAVDLMPGRLAVRQIERRRGEFHAARTVAEFPLAEA